MANRSSATHFLRLIAGAAGAALASLAVVEPRTWNQLVLSIGVSEWGHVLAALGLATIAPGWRRTPAGRAGAALGALTALLSLLSLARAALYARRVPSLLSTAFGDAAPRSRPGAAARPRPLVARDVLRGVRSPRVGKQRLVYVDRGEHALALDVYRAAGQTKDEGRRTKSGELVRRPSSLVHPAPAPCVVVVHGGSWQSGNSEQLPALSRYLAARGYVVASINYRLAPAHHFPAQRDDLLAAIDFLKAHAGELGIDAQRLVLLGRSAGGHLALQAAYTANDPAIRGVVAFYAPTDLLWGYNNPARKRIIDGTTIIESFLGGSPSAIPAAYADASPLGFGGAACPPTLLIHGDRDNLVSPHQSEMLADRLQTAGCRHLYLNLPWATHGGDYNFSGPTGQVSTYAVERFLSAVTR
jgi:acetyl esterase/lipase